MEMLGVPRYPPFVLKYHAEHARTRKHKKEQGQANYQVPKKLTKQQIGERKIKIVQKIKKEINRQNEEDSKKPNVEKSKEKIKSG